MDLEKRIYSLAGISLLIGVASVVVPRFVPNPEGGFASGASAALTFLVLLGVALLFSIYLLVMTCRQFRELPVTAKIVGLAPSIVFGITLLALIVFLNF